MPDRAERENPRAERRPHSEKKEQPLSVAAKELKRMILEAEREQN